MNKKILLDFEKREKTLGMKHYSCKEGKNP
jgi:hypothetical protein